MTAAIIAGFLSGIISGMGIGGGTILIPALSIFLNVGQHEAQGVNLLYFIPTAIISLWVHIKNKAVNFKVAVPVILFGLAGAVGGSLLAGVIEGKLLRRLFGFFLLAMGLYEIFKKDKKRKKEQEK
ncbi:MAG: sulfite exporter TauE/SafE family protein [Ruminococcaceae bacterium]|nr:sulfite exporter TauE/SafE family protein [Oscillospiraceae bacterium]